MSKAVSAASPWDLFERAPAGYLLLDRKGTVLRVNQACRQSLGYSEQELLGRCIDDFVVTPGFSFAVLADGHRDSQYVESMPLALRQRSGGEIHVRLNADLAGDDVQCIYLDVTETKRLAEQRLALIGDLSKALAEIRTLRGFLPICASCKKIRDDKGHWQPVEKYVSERADVEFSHGLCPRCVDELYPGLVPSKG